MVFFQVPVISAQTFFKVYIVHGFILGACIFTAYKLLKRSRRWLNIILSLFYIFMAIGFFLNMYYVVFSMVPYQDMVRAIYLSLMFVLLLGTFFLTIFSLILLKTEKIFTKPKQFALILIFIIFDLIALFIPEAITIGPETNWNPVWNPVYYIYVFTIFSAFSVIPQIYCFIKIYNRLEQPFLLKRWKYFIVGTILFYIMCYGTITYQTLDIQLVRVIWAYVSLFLSIGSIVLIYYGFVKLE